MHSNILSNFNACDVRKSKATSWLLAEYFATLSNDMIPANLLIVRSRGKRTENRIAFRSVAMRGRGASKQSALEETRCILNTILCRIRCASSRPHTSEIGFFSHEAIKIWIKSHSRRARNTPAARQPPANPINDCAAGKFIRVTGVLLQRHILLRSPVYLRHGCAFRVR